MAMTVKVAKVPGLIKEVALPDGATVACALTAAEISADGFSIQVSGQVASSDTVLSNNATVMLTQRIKGNA